MGCDLGPRATRGCGARYRVQVAMATAVMLGGCFGGRGSLDGKVIDVANGALQFSILGGTEDPSQWPDYLDESRFKRFIRGYDEVDVVSVAELEVIPWLMVEALVASTILLANGGHEPWALAENA